MQLLSIKYKMFSIKSPVSCVRCLASTTRWWWHVMSSVWTLGLVPTTVPALCPIGRVINFDTIIPVRHVMLMVTVCPYLTLTWQCSWHWVQRECHDSVAENAATNKTQFKHKHKWRFGGRGRSLSHVVWGRHQTDCSLSQHRTWSPQQEGHDDTRRLVKPASHGATSSTVRFMSHRHQSYDQCDKCGMCHCILGCR